MGPSCFGRTCSSSASAPPCSGARWGSSARWREGRRSRWLRSRRSCTSARRMKLSLELPGSSGRRKSGRSRRSGRRWRLRSRCRGRRRWRNRNRRSGKRWLRLGRHMPSGRRQTLLLGGLGRGVRGGDGRRSRRGSAWSLCSPLPRRQRSEGLGTCVQAAGHTQPLPDSQLADSLPSHLPSPARQQHRPSLPPLWPCVGQGTCPCPPQQPLPDSPAKQPCRGGEWGTGWRRCRSCRSCNCGSR
ncbi:hypothetical protein T492DRAFT_1102510 [Pavlovales sp. CCMP2436]|nr:hypothetical protein T492DRAFT_1102510 [Pavlovales sp. CCMP2436]